jgi:hypothetical protein
MAQAQRLVIALTVQGADLRHTFDPSELQHPKSSEIDFRLLLLTGLLTADTYGYRIAYPDLVLASIRRDWLPLALDFAPSDDFSAVINAARLMALNEDNFMVAFLPELVGAVEQDLLPPASVISAILNLSGSTVVYHALLLQELINRLDAAWQHKSPDDTHRQFCIRDANFLLKRFAQPQIERPVEDVKTEVGNLLACAQASLNRERLWAAIDVADATANVSALDQIRDYFDAHPEFQADLLIGCLKADTESGYNLFLALLRRPTFTCQAAAAYVAAAFPDWIDRFSMSLLRAYVQISEVHSDDPAQRFIASLWAFLTSDPA